MPGVVSDHTGCIDCAFWNEDVRRFAVGDVLLFLNCYNNIHERRMTLQPGASGRVLLMRGEMGLPVNPGLRLSDMDWVVRGGVWEPACGATTYDDESSSSLTFPGSDE